MFWLTVRSDIDHQFTCLLRAQLLCTTKEAEALLQSGTAKEGEAIGYEGVLPTI